MRPGGASACSRRRADGSDTRCRAGSTPPRCGSPQAALLHRGQGGLGPGIGGGRPGSQPAPAIPGALAGRWCSAWPAASAQVREFKAGALPSPGGGAVRAVALGERGHRRTRGSR